MLRPLYLLALTLGLASSAAADDGELIFSSPSAPNGWHITSISIEAQGGAWRDAQYQPPGSAGRSLSKNGGGFHLASVEDPGSSNAILALYKVTISFTTAQDFVFYWDTRDRTYWSNPWYGCNSAPGDIDIRVAVSSDGIVTYKPTCWEVPIELSAGETLKIWKTSFHSPRTPDQSFETPYESGSFWAPSSAATWETFTVTADYELPGGFTGQGSFWVNRRSTETGLWTGWSQNCINQPDCAYTMDRRYGTMKIRFDLTIGTPDVGGELAPVSITKTVVDQSGPGGPGGYLTAAPDLPAKPYPNPVTDRVMIPLPAPNAGAPGFTTLEVYDETGRLVHAGPVESGVGTIGVGVQGFAAGVYRVILRAGGEAVGASSFVVVR